MDFRFFSMQKRKKNVDKNDNCKFESKIMSHQALIASHFIPFMFKGVKQNYYRGPCGGTPKPRTGNCCCTDPCLEKCVSYHGLGIHNPYDYMKPLFTFGR